MINKLVWGLYFEEFSDIINTNGYVESIRFYTFINFHRLSITHAKKLGYECILYIPFHLHKYFLDLGITLKIPPDVGNTFFDYIKNYILSVEEGDYLIIDGDLILNNRLPNITADLIYEKKESQSWDLFYKNEVENLTKLGIGDIIPEWTGKKRFDVINIGLVHTNDEEFKKIWIDRWNRVKNFVESNVKEKQTRYTPIAAQYMLTELVHYYNLNVKEFETNSPKNTYIHYMGDKKLTAYFIPTDRILTFNPTLI
jgi:hypothetical protein